VALLGGAPAAMVKVEAEAEVEVEVEVEVEEIGEGEEVAVLGAAIIVVVVQWAEAVAEEVPLVVVQVDVVGVTSVSGKRPPKRSTLLSSRRKRTR